MAAKGIETAKKILALGRLRFLSIGIALYTMGSLLALLSGAGFDAVRFAFGYLILFLGHLSVHYSNDYFDHEADRLNRSSATSGGSGILAENPELLRFSRQFGLTLALLSVFCAACFTAAYALPLSYLGFAVLGNLISWHYTAPPLRMAYRQWGVLASTFSVGFLMPAIGDFSTFGRFSPLFMAFALPLFLQALSFLISVQMPDMEGDRLAGKRTFVASYGRSAGFLAMLLSAGAAAIYYAAASLINENMVYFKWAAIVSLLPLGMAAYGYAGRNASREKAMDIVKYYVICYVFSILLLDAILAIALLQTL
jgi:1,4-dihydroxy-2-naphthoate octaprenyltransferase